jgi:phi LC3 family holin|nr:MAG TPA: holin [Caudoviricetes sp.]
MNNINWIVRFKNKAFWVALIPAILLLIQVVAAVFGFTLDLGDLGNKLLDVVNALFAVLTILGIVVDPTTAGTGDSEQAMTYTEPKKKGWYKMSNSSLVSYTLLSPNHSGKRTHSIDRITPHCVVGQLSAASICGCFTSPDCEASCNYGIGKDGQIALCVDEGNRSWCSSSDANDQRAVTIECASDKEHPYAMTDAVYQSLIKLCVDICRRNEKNKLLWFGDKDKTLAYEPKAGEMVLTVHRWFANKACPGDWLYSRLGDLAAKVTAQLGSGASTPSTDGTLYRVQAGAFKNKENADRQLEKIKAAGFDTYMVQAGGYYKIQVGAYSVKANAENMLAKVKAAGFDAFITTEQGQAVSSTPAKKSIDEIAREVIRGDWGNGQDRKDRLTAAGYDYDAVQARVNQLL